MHKIIRYQVNNPLLRNYVKFFWELHIDDAQLNHKLIPQRNINLRFNLNETPQYACSDGNNKIGTKVLGHKSYANGVRQIIEGVLKYDLENQKNMILDLIKMEFLTKVNLFYQFQVKHLVPKE
jgi:hypothetical protein